MNWREYDALRRLDRGEPEEPDQSRPSFLQSLAAQMGVSYDEAVDRLNAAYRARYESEAA